MSPTSVSFAFDPLCPWCWQTSKWMRRCAHLGAADVTWGVYSLELAHHADGPAAGDPIAPGVRGLLLWVVPTDPDDPASEPAHGFNPLNRPAEQVIRRAFLGEPESAS